MRGSVREDYFDDDWDDRRTKVKYVVTLVSVVVGTCLLFSSIPMFVISISGYHVSPFVLCLYLSLRAYLNAATVGNESVEVNQMQRYTPDRTRDSERFKCLLQSHIFGTCPQVPM